MADTDDYKPLQKRSCTWKQDPIDGYWWSDCGLTWEFTDGDPSENGALYCPGCGSRIKEEALVDG